MQNVKLDVDQVADIRKALIIGLAAYGEIQMKQNAAALASHGSNPWPDEHVPADPTGTCDVPSQFATALAYLEHAR